MSKKEKIAESIIIRVGGGIREVVREPVEASENIEPVHRAPDIEQSEDVHPLGTELRSNTKIELNKIIN